MNTRAADWFVITSAPAAVLYVLADPGIVRGLTDSMSDKSANSLEFVLFCLAYFAVWWIVGRCWDRRERLQAEPGHPPGDADRPLPSDSSNDPAR